MKIIFSVILTVLCFSFSHSEEPENYRLPFQGSRLVNLQSVVLADPGELQLHIQHRFGDISGGFYELFGLDQASMRLGFEYGLTDHVTFGAGRSTFMKTYDAYGKLMFVRQSSSFPLSIGASITGSIPTVKNIFPETDGFGDKMSGHAQLHISKTAGPLAFQISPGYMTTGTVPFIEESWKFFNLGFGTSVTLSRKVSINAEYIPRFDKTLPNQDPFSIGIDVDTGGHLFQLMLSNTQHMTDQSVLTGSSGKWSDGRLFFGFNLIREFKIKYK